MVDNISPMVHSNPMSNHEDRINLKNEDSTAKINAYYRSYFADLEEDEGSPYREDQHVGELGWNQ